jgi:hypothetical protein
MKVQFEWHAGTDDGQWETVAQTEKRRPFRWLRRVPWWGWSIVIAVFVIVGVGGYLVVRSRYEEAQHQIGFQVQSVIDLEARAFAAGDVELFLEQQDSTARDWYALQRERIQEECVEPPAAALVPQVRCFSVPPATVQEVALRGDVAWVEVVEEGSDLHQVRFYRQTSLGWKHTAPRPEFFKVPVELTYGNLVFRYHRRDEPYVEPLIERVFVATRDLCATMDCTPLAGLEVIFAIDVPAERPPYIEGNKLFLPSPWLTGVPPDKTWGEGRLQELTYWVVYALAGQIVRDSPSQPLSQLQKAILSEYAVWYIRRDLTLTPLLGRVANRHGEFMLPKVLSSLRNTRRLSDFFDEWLALRPLRQEVPYFETLLNVEREAIHLGYKETFLLFQGDSHYQQERSNWLFARIQGLRTSPSSLEVSSVEISPRRARVTIKSPSVGSVRGQTREGDAVVFFQLQDGDWRHSSFPTILLIGSAQPSRESPNAVSSLPHARLG